jgi:hypothetical protein
MDTPERTAAERELRDRIAMRAMQAIVVAAQHRLGYMAEEIAKRSYAMAEAMLTSAGAFASKS